jgi:hypothetical protein
MRQEKINALRKLLISVIPTGKLSVEEIDALVLYMAEVSTSEDEAIKRLSGILQSDLNGSASIMAMLHVELLRDKLADVHVRLRAIENAENQEMKKWPFVQAIFTAISFFAAIVAFLKAFGLIQLPWP